MNRELKSLTDEELKHVTGGNGVSGSWETQCSDLKSQAECEQETKCQWATHYNNSTNPSNPYAGNSYHVCEDKPVQIGGSASGDW